jgi:peptide-methionine (R)-S-oxide reductase
MPELKEMPDDYWRGKLTAEQYRVLRESGTEPPFVGEFVDTEAPGMYKCAACGLELFRSDTKFHSGSGWPSFWDATDRDRVELVDDDSHGMHRVEVKCARCGSHLGHLFPDGPSEHGGQRYCINSLSLQFDPMEKSS